MFFCSLVGFLPSVWLFAIKEFFFRISVSHGKGCFPSPFHPNQTVSCPDPHAPRGHVSNKAGLLREGGGHLMLTGRTESS